MANGLGCDIQRTATEQKMAFHSIVRNVLGAEDEHTEDILLDIQQNLSYMIDEYEETHDEDADAFVLDKATIGKLLEESNVPEEKINRIEKGMDEAFGEKLPVAENVIDAKALEQNVVRIEKQELESQLSTLSGQLTEKDAKLQEFTQQLNEKEAALQERTSQLMEKQEEIDNYKAETKNYDVVLHVKPEKANQIHSSIINGQRCLVIPMNEDEQASINGVNTNL
jgi:DNA repair exonuclease SbcCD ATPase subunit